MNPPDLFWQPSLLEASDRISIDADFRTLVRIHLDEWSWVDHQPGWVSGADRLFADLVSSVDWGQRERWMYGRRLPEPRLTARYDATVNWPPVLEDMGVTLSQRYGVTFDSVGLNLYRDGRDSVAWHGDRIPSSITEPVVALVSLGGTRSFRLRPAPGGQPRAGTRSFYLGRADLLVTGGRCQREWQHSVPKVGHAGPRISLAFRHGQGGY